MENENILLNPIDIIEDVIHQKKWNFSRAADHELVAEIASHWCAYRLYFTWSENINALSFSITFDIKFPETKLNKAYELLGLINENLWIGHFDITSKNGIPAFRHTLLSNNSILISPFDLCSNLSIIIQLSIIETKYMKMNIWRARHDSNMRPPD